LSTAPYSWVDAEPGEVKRADLPMLTAEVATRFISKAVVCMTAAVATSAGISAFPAISARPTVGNASEFDQLYGDHSGRFTKYASVALDGCTAELAAVAEGSRNDTLNKFAFRMGRMIANGWIDRGRVHDRLLAAALACGLDEHEARQTLRSGLAAGEQSPREAPRRQHPNGGNVSGLENDKTGDNSARELPQPLFRKLPPADPFPIQALGEVLANAARAIEDRVQVPSAIAAQSVLAAAALAVQAHANIQTPFGQTKPISCFFVTIAESGDRKTACDEIAAKAVQEREADLRLQYDIDVVGYNADKRAYDAAIKKAQSGKVDRATIRRNVEAVGAEPSEPLIPMLVCDEPTFEGLTKLFYRGHPSLGIFSGEGGAFIGGHGMAEEARLRTATGLSSFWDGTPIKRVRGSEGASILVGRRLSMHLMLQPVVADLLFEDELIGGQGLLSRFLMVRPDSIAGSRLSRQEQTTTPLHLAAYRDRLAACLAAKVPLLELRRNELHPRVLMLSEEAAQLWRDFSDHVERQLKPDAALAPVAPLANKLAEHAGRLAAVMTLFDDLAATEISGETFARALEIAQFYAEEALRMYGTGGINPLLRNAEKLRCWLLNAWSERNIGLRHICRFGPGSIRDAATARKLATILEQHHWLAPISGGAVVDGAKCREAWQIIREDDHDSL
jgi:Protein of unknown function (DUF3987)